MSHKTSEAYCHDNGHSFETWRGMEICIVCGILEREVKKHGED